MQPCQNGPKQTLVSAWLKQTTSTSQNNASSAKHLHIMSHQTLLADLPNISSCVTAVTAPLARLLQELRKP
jgi:hypothetical protein